MNVTITKEGQTKEYAARRGQTILTLLQKNRISGIEAPCGGMGRCGKCKVEIVGRGEVLACKTLVADGMHIIIGKEKHAKIAETGQCHNQYSTDALEEAVAACDIGTTTVVCHLIDGISGNIIATESAPNAQKNYGADVVSRIERAGAGELQKLHEVIAGQIETMLEKLCEKSHKKKKIQRLAVAGNTVMCHLFAGLSPEAIGVAPFMPEELFGKEYTGSSVGIDCCEIVNILPCVAGYVGSDITADVLAAVPEDGGQWLLLDIGTNGEMLLGNAKDGYVCCATAAGPAFEGAEITMGMPAADGAISSVICKDRSLYVGTIGEKEAVGICGSGLLDALAVFLESGLMDESGMLMDEEEVPEECRHYIGRYEGQACVWLTEKVCVTQEDVRNLQLAKAAIAAGIEILLKEKAFEYKDVTGVLLAGGFGSFLNKESAAKIGLIPKELLPVTEAVGNAAGEGAVFAAISNDARNHLLEIRSEMHYLELSMHPAFSDLYMECISFASYSGE